MAADSSQKEVHPLLRAVKREGGGEKHGGLTHERLCVLNKKYVWEILSDLHNGAKNITQLSEDNGIPYSTAQRVVAELERVSLVQTVERQEAWTGRPVKRVMVESFTLTLSLSDIVEAVEKRRRENPRFLK